MAFPVHTILPTSAGGPYCVSPAFGAATCNVTTQQKAAGLIFGVAVPGQFAAIPVATFLDGGVTPAWAGVNGGGNLDLITQVNAQIVIPGTTTPGITDFIEVEAGLAASGVLRLNAYDIHGNLLGSQPMTGVGPHGRRIADIGAAGIAYIVVFTTNPADPFGVNEYDLDDITALISIACPLNSDLATVGTLFTSNAPVVTGDTPPDVYALLSGPAWMSINAATGVVSGIPTTPGAFTYVIQVTDSLANVATTAPGCTVTVAPAPIVPTAGSTPPILKPNKSDFCLHREYRLFCNIDYQKLGCAKLPHCFTVDEREWGEHVYP